MTFQLLDLRILFRSIRREAAQPEFSWQRVMKQYRLYCARARQRQQLLRLSDHQLKDIGLTRIDALYEANKPFWVE